MKNKWAERLAKYQHSQYINHNGISFKPPQTYSTSRRVDRAVTRLRLKHNLLTGSVGYHILGGSPICPECKVRNTTEHYLLDCSVHGRARFKFSGALQRIGVTLEMKNVLFPSKALQTSTFLALETYLLDCQMADKI